jgi:alkanesulfonate monooxygenase SsuD/methylene tetrahydromethanopterin reductase-like flavin-dependent oxidoreductase (luciferase family)
MKFDLFCLMQQRDASWSAADVYDDVADQVSTAEQIGMHTAWFAEHHFSNYSLCPSPVMAAAYFAGRTERIRLGTGVVVLPLYEPMRLAQEIAMVDTLSKGRMVLGIGSGYQAYEFERFRTVLDDDVMERTLEAADVIEMALTRPQFEHHGPHYDYPPTQIAIKAVGERMPEVWIAGMNPILLDRVAARGHGLMVTPSWKAISEIAPLRTRLDELCAAHGRDPATVPLGVMRFVHVTNSKAEALEAAERARYSSRVSVALRLNYAKLNGTIAEDTPADDEPPLEDMVDNYIIGDADHCIEQILKDHETMRHSNMLCNVQLGGVPRDRVMRTLEALGTDIIPAVDKQLGTTDSIAAAQ